MKKQVIETQEAIDFVDGMDTTSRMKYVAYVEILQTHGALVYPMAEKVGCVVGLFAMRIMTRTNERIFYCYAEGSIVLIL